MANPSYFAAPGVRSRVKYTQEVRIDLAKSLFAAIENVFGITAFEMGKKCREQHIVVPRMMCQYILRTKCYWSLPKIAQMFSQDHSTVINSVKKVKDRCDTEPEFKAALQAVENLL